MQIVRIWRGEWPKQPRFTRIPIDSPLPPYAVRPCAVAAKVMQDDGSSSHRTGITWCGGYPATRLVKRVVWTAGGHPPLQHGWFRRGVCTSTALSNTGMITVPCHRQSTGSLIWVHRGQRASKDHGPCSPWSPSWSCLLSVVLSSRCTPSLAAWAWGAGDIACSLQRSGAWQLRVRGPGRELSHCHVPVLRKVLPRAGLAERVT